MPLYRPHLLLAAVALALALAVLPTSANIAKYELLAYDSTANPAAVVVSGKARFTVLTTHLLRMEYDEQAHFEDRGTQAFLNRNVSVPHFTQSTSGDTLTITTDALELTYKTNTAFSASTLQVRSTNSSSAFTSWSYGQTSSTDPGNLLGTFRTLDQTMNVTLNCTENQQEHCEWGLISRSGWALVDDHNVPCFDADDWWVDAAGVMLNNSNEVDLYLFAHGHDYRQALADFTLVSGRIPLLPRFSSGIWFTRWYDFSQSGYRHIVEQYRNYGMPLDSIVQDMQFHKKNSWTGYTFDTSLIPYPADSMSFLRAQGLALAVNIHDAAGIGPYEEKYVEMCQAMGIDPSLNKTIPFTLVNKTYVRALDDIVMANILKDTEGFFWLDWQQGETAGGTGQDGPRHKMNPTQQTNRMRVTYHKRHNENKRGVVLARYGGLGTNRYQHGFSGDVKGLLWQNLAYQPYFSATASNVAYGFWSHDIEGPGNDHEMYTRWIQWGSYSPIMRSHERGMSAGPCFGWPTDITGCSNVRPYNVPFAFLQANRKALVARATLIPYLYTGSRQAFETGISIVRPLYYEFPEHNEAYLADSLGNYAEYMLGDNLLVAPVVVPAVCPGANTTGLVLTEPCGLANTTTWLPPIAEGWFDLEMGRLRAGGAMLHKGWHLSEIPVFVRGGAIVPRIPVVAGDTLGLAQRDYSQLEFDIYPGMGVTSGQTRVYEDDGKTMDYLTKDAFAWTTANYTRTSSTVHVAISTAGSYPALPGQRNYLIRLVNVPPPTSVTATTSSSSSPEPIGYTRFGPCGNSCWTYSGPTLSLEVLVWGVETAGGMSLAVEFAESTAPATTALLNSGLRGMLSRASLAKDNLDETRITPGAHTPDPNYLKLAGSTADALSYLAGADAAAFTSTVAGYPALYDNAIASIQNLSETGAREVGSMGYGTHRGLLVGEASSGRVQYSIDLLNDGKQ